MLRARKYETKNVVVFSKYFDNPNIKELLNLFEDACVLINKHYSIFKTNKSITLQSERKFDKFFQNISKPGTCFSKI